MSSVEGICGEARDRSTRQVRRALEAEIAKDLGELGGMP